MTRNPKDKFVRPRNESAWRNETTRLQVAFDEHARDECNAETARGCLDQEVEMFIGILRLQRQFRMPE